MGYVPSRKFCCCLPVRFGVFCMTILGLVFGSLLCAAGWFEIHKQATGGLDLDKREIISLWFVSVSYTFLAVISVLGFVGACGRIRGLIVFYAYTITISTIVNIAVGILFVWTLFHRDAGTVQKCQDSIQDQGDANFKHWVCQKGFDAFRVLITIGFVIIWIFMIAGIFIVFDYVGQLSEEYFVRLEEEDKQRLNPPTIIVAEGSSMRTTYESNMEGGGSSSKQQ